MLRDIAININILRWLSFLIILVFTKDVVISLIWKIVQQKLSNHLIKQWNCHRLRIKSQWKRLEIEKIWKSSYPLRRFIQFTVCLEYMFHMNSFIYCFLYVKLFRISLKFISSEIDYLSTWIKNNIFFFFLLLVNRIICFLKVYLNYIIILYLSLS
jgi:hypothetical protein